MLISLGYTFQPNLVKIYGRVGSYGPGSSFRNGPTDQWTGERTRFNVPLST